MRWAAGRPGAGPAPVGTVCPAVAATSPSPCPATTQRFLRVPGATLRARTCGADIPRGCWGDQGGRQALPSSLCARLQLPSCSAGTARLSGRRRFTAPPCPHLLSEASCGVFGSSSIQSGGGRWLPRYDLGGSVASGRKSLRLPGERHAPRRLPSDTLRRRRGPPVHPVVGAALRWTRAPSCGGSQRDRLRAESPPSDGDERAPVPAPQQLRRPQNCPRDQVLPHLLL